MKKFLAILLSVIMLFTLGVAAFAEGETEEAPAEMPANIGKLEGKIVVSIDNTYIEPSQSYQIPIRIYADYLDKLPEEAETFYIGSNGIALLNDMDAKGYATITSIECTDAIPEENRIEIGFNEDVGDSYFTFSINKDQFSTLLSTPDEGVIIGYVNIETTDQVPEEYGVDFGNIGIFGGYDLSWMIDGAWGTAGYMDADGNFTEIALNGDSEDDIVFDTACFYHQPKTLTWQERLKDWAKQQALLFLGFFITVLSVLEEFLKQA